jgi:CubicO group peptidase (beta-lactamase class C family)
MSSWPITSLMTFLLLLLARPPARAQQAPLAGLDDYVNRAMKDWGVPGLAIAVIKDDRIVLARGYGVRELGKPEPVDERTIFAIGSSSKAFTAAAIAITTCFGSRGATDRWADSLSASDSTRRARSQR